jgi:G:T/U-mismatch repair DNA glycosylase
MQEQETHPWKWFAAKNSSILIVGTFPTARHNWKYEFYYPNTANLFWRVMAAILKKELQYFSGEEAVDERKKILQKLPVAITDMGHTIIRNDNSSLDEKLIAVEYMDIFQILEENPGINKILFTSSSGAVSAAGWFNNFLKEKGIKHKFPKGKKPLKSQIEFNGRKIELVVLYSTSPRASNRISFDKLVELYKNEILPGN